MGDQGSPTRSIGRRFESFTAHAWVRRGSGGNEGPPGCSNGRTFGVHRLIGVTVVTGAGMTAAAHRASRFAT